MTLTLATKTELFELAVAHKAEATVKRNFFTLSTVVFKTRPREEVDFYEECNWLLGRFSKNVAKSERLARAKLLV